MTKAHNKITKTINLNDVIIKLKIYKYSFKWCNLNETKKTLGETNNKKTLFIYLTNWII